MLLTLLFAILVPGDSNARTIFANFFIDCLFAIGKLSVDSLMKELKRLVLEGK